MLFESIASAVGLPGPNARKPYPTSLVVVTQPDASPAPDDVRRVVIAEDEALIRMDLAEMLDEEGYAVVGQAEDGERAVALATDRLASPNGRRMKFSLTEIDCTR